MIEFIITVIVIAWFASWVIPVVVVWILKILGKL